MVGERRKRLTGIENHAAMPSLCACANRLVGLHGVKPAYDPYVLAGEERGIQKKLLDLGSGPLGQRQIYI
jgi:hypothetical protein